MRPCYRACYRFAVRCWYEAANETNHRAPDDHDELRDRVDARQRGAPAPAPETVAGRCRGRKTPQSRSADQNPGVRSATASCQSYKGLAELADWRKTPDLEADWPASCPPVIRQFVKVRYSSSE